jgi:diguanylate cyclase (GGDEF)-like protein
VATATGLAALLGGILRQQLLDGPLWSSTFILWTRNGVTTFLGVALLTTFPRHLGLPGLPSRRRLLGDVVIWAFAVSVYAFVFVVNVDTPLAYFVLPVVVLIGLRWSTHIGVWHMLASGVFVLLATFEQRGPFADGDPVIRAALAQGLIGCALVIVLTVALYRDSRARLLEQLEAAHRETRQAAERLRHSSLHDPLTGLANRQRLMQVLDDELARAAGAETRVGVIFLDLDGFKAVNDTFGHAEGDRLLDAVATRLRVLLRPADAVARLGGDEFVMVCPALSMPSQLAAIADRVSTTLALPYELLGGHTHSDVSASVGTSLSSNDSSADQLLREADTSMYAAKRARKLRTSKSPA